jgi:hypothetical protein
MVTADGQRKLNGHRASEAVGSIQLPDRFNELQINSAALLELTALARDHAG